MGPRARQNALQRVVTLVTRVLVNVARVTVEFQFTGKRHCKRIWIAYCICVDDLVYGDSPETLGDDRVFRRSSETLFGREAGGLDDKRIAFPMTNGIAHPLANRGRRVRSANAYEHVS